MDPEYARRYRDLYERHWWWRAREHLILPALPRHPPPGRWPAIPLLWTTHDDLNHHVARYTQRSFRALAREAGLRVERARYFFHWGFAAKLLVRLYEAAVRPPPAPPRVPPRSLNRLLYLASRLEQRVLTPLSLPFGSSLLVVAVLPHDLVTVGTAPELAPSNPP